MFNSIDRIYLSAPEIGELEKEYIAEAFSTNWVAPLGPHVDAFETELAVVCGRKGSAVLSSGTAAIHLALILAGVKQGDRVYCSSLTFAASINPAVYLGALPVFIDAEPESWNMSPEVLERALKYDAERGLLPKAVIAVNLYGQSADFDKIVPLCEKYKVALIEDAAESLGALYKGRPSGSFGRFSILSFNGNKIITTSGGGALLSDDTEALAEARFLATQARDAARYYQHSRIGYNYRMSNICAAIGRGQLVGLPDKVEKRRGIFELYRQAFQEIAEIHLMPEPDWSQGNRWLTVLNIDEGSPLEPYDLMDILAAENIESRPVWKPMHLQPVFAGSEFWAYDSEKPAVSSGGETENISGCQGCFPGGVPLFNSKAAELSGDMAGRLFSRGLCLPSGSGMTGEEQQRVIDIVVRAFQDAR